MITHDPHRFVQAWKSRIPRGPATMRGAMLVDTRHFRVSEESATDNRYMVPGTPVDPARAAHQWARVGGLLRTLGLPVLTFPGQPGQDDGIFPNNVYAFAPGRFVVGSMRHSVRQAEARRADVRAWFEAAGRATVDLSLEPGVGELTGVLAIDRMRNAAVAGMSQRVDGSGLQAMAAALGLEAVLATPLVPAEYHVNMVLAVLAGRAGVVWDAAFEDPEVGRALEAGWPGAWLHLNDAEKQAFAGNCIAVTPHDVVMSATSLGALRPTTLSWFAGHGFAVHAVEIDELEKGGGSLRCLIAEIF